MVRCGSAPSRERRSSLRGKGYGKLIRMGYRLTGLSAFNFGAQWERVAGDEEVARRIMIFMADRRLLFGDRHDGDELECLHSSVKIRDHLTNQIVEAKPGRTLEQKLTLLREAARRFADRAGPNASKFRESPVQYGLALGDLRTAFAVHLAAIAEEFDLELEYDLAQLVFPDWVTVDDGEEDE
jgi:hypothetical protein